ncbi:SURF1 family protein [Cumulibacter soli]|uniref:SURF1 family cytochrome oxidase biogenesis protein n=1 Tax=Cumulibacter soli TaxID=2546344 RepID=UPI0010687CF0|nr:SURF1 family protein [Cumulibacter soli]
MYRFLATPRWIAGFLALLLAAAIMVRLGYWQWDRGQQKSAANDAVQAAQQRDPVPAGDLIPATAENAPAAADEWSQVTISGEYDPANTVLIRQRSFEGGVGFEVVVPFHGEDGVTYLIDRGYVLATGGAAQEPDVPAPPTGTVTVTGIVKRAYDAPADATRVEQVGSYDSVRALDPAVLSASFGQPLAGGYIIASDEQLADGSVIEDINRIPPPELSDGPHLSYAVQWWIFAAMTLFVFGYLARREAITRLLADEDEDDEDTRSPAYASSPTDT